MLAVKGIYNGKTIRPLEVIKEKRNYMVAITFLEPILEPIQEKERVISSKLKILKPEDIENLKEMVSLGGDALIDTERYYE